MHGLSLVAVSGGYSLLLCAGFSLRWLLLLWSTGSRCVGFSSCGMRAQQLWLAGSRVQAQQLWCTGLVALWHVGSSRTRDRTCVPCIGRWIPNHCTTTEVPDHLLMTFCLGKYTFTWFMLSDNSITFCLMIRSCSLPSQTKQHSV